MLLLFGGCSFEPPPIPAQSIPAASSASHLRCAHDWSAAIGYIFVISAGPPAAIATVLVRSGFSPKSTGFALATFRALALCMTAECWWPY